MPTRARLLQGVCGRWVGQVRTSDINLNQDKFTTDFDWRIFRYKKHLASCVPDVRKNTNKWRHTFRSIARFCSQLKRVHRLCQSFIISNLVKISSPVHAFFNTTGMANVTGEFLKLFVAANVPNFNTDYSNVHHD